MSEPEEAVGDQDRMVDLLVALAEEGMASGIDAGFDIDAFIAETRAEG